MTNATAISQVAVSAQRNLHQIAVYERSMRQRGALIAAAAIGVYRSTEQRRLDECAGQFAALQPANDVVFQPTPEHA